MTMTMIPQHPPASQENLSSVRLDSQTGQWASPSAAVPKLARPVKENPFQAYRDPNTGRWCVLRPHSGDEGNLSDA